MSRFSLALSAIALLLGAVPLHAQNLVTNGTFASNANGWTLSPGGCTPASWDGGTGNPPGSVLLNECGESDSDPFASQAIGGLTPGATYTISVEVLLQNPGSNFGTGKSFGIFLDNEPGTPLLFAEFGDSLWHTVTVKFVATSTSHTIIFASELDARTPGGPGVTTDVSYWIDNVSLVPSGGSIATNTVPAMSDTALIVLGVLLAACAALALRRRRALFHRR